MGGLLLDLENLNLRIRGVVSSSSGVLVIGALARGSVRVRD